MRDDGKRGFWREPMVWMIIGLPLSAVIAAVTSAVIAFKHQDSLVSEDIHKVGLVTTQGRDREDKAASLGLSARLHIGPDHLDIALDGLSNWPDMLNLKLVHPTEAGQDKVYRLHRVDAAGHYAASFASTKQGRRLLVLEPADASWRLVGVLQSPLQGEILLGAGTRNPPTHH